MDKRTILLVDDHATTRKLVRLALERAGFVVHEARDGATALELMREHRPAIVIQDLVLPDVDGFALAARLRGLAGEAPLRLLAFSGLVSNLDAKRISSGGFDDVIAKPISPARLVALVEAQWAGIEPSTESFGNGKRVLVVDDDSVQLHLTSVRVGRWGFQVEEARDGQHALELARQSRPDIIVSDVLMPRLDGFGLAMAVRRDEELHATPVILLSSSYVESTDRELATRAGADDFVLHSPDLGELSSALRAVTSRGKVRPATPSVPTEELEREHARRTMRQLERQLLHNSELMRRSSQLSAELTILTSLSEAVLQQRDVESALVTALSTCFDASNSSFGALYLIDKHKHLRVRALGAHPSADATELSTFFGREAWLRELVEAGNSTLLSNSDDGNPSVAGLLARAKVKQAIVVPLVHLGVPLGALFMAARGDDRLVELEQWRNFAQGIANQITQAVALAQAFREREVAEREAEQHKRLARDQAAVWRALVDHAPDVVMHLDTTGRIRFINRIPRDVAAGARLGTWFDSMAPEYHTEMRSSLTAVVQQGQARTIETSRRAPDGSVSFCESHLGPVRTGSEVVGALVIERDVTHKKQTEAQLIIADRMASVGSLAAGVAHEINNPLASVIANLDLALREVRSFTKEGSSSELLDELTDACEAADRVRRIVRDLRIFSRVDETKRAPVEIERVLDSAARMAWNEVRHRARLIKEYSKVPLVYANEARLGQVFLNLLINAAQAIDSGGADRNEIRLHLDTDELGRVVVTVSDSGCGIPAAVRARLFTPFVTTKTPGVGTGLGLSICHRIVTELGGTITLTSEPGRGAEFRVVLPCCVAPDLSQDTVQLGGSVATRRGRVLVIDDEPLITQVVRRTLSREHDVFTFDDAHEAFRRIEGGERYDVILCDLLMPRMSGMDFHRLLAPAFPDQAARIVFFTGGAFTPGAREFLDSVGNSRLEKPVDGQELRALINGLVR
jgi:PAS domain S-box-containing protein